MGESGFRRGDSIAVRGAAEILRTLDEHGAMDALPFMPEMVKLCGRHYAVDRRAEKVCDTVTNNLQSRRLLDTVLLDDLRCDGSGHGGCEAECRYYWKEAWLRRVEPGEPPGDVVDLGATRELLDLVQQNALVAAGGPDSVRYRCQATQLVEASVALSTTDPRTYVRELSKQNVSIRTFARVMSRAAVMQPLHHMGRLPMPPLKGPSSKSPPATQLDLEPGEWVRVKSRDEIRQQLTEKGANRGLWFDREMMAMCGKVFQVRGRVTRIVDERSGKMIELTSDCITLEDGVCSGELSTGRWFCPREIHSYWRECWLERVDVPAAVRDGSHSVSLNGVTSPG